MLITLKININYRDLNILQKLKVIRGETMNPDMIIKTQFRKKVRNLAIVKMDIMVIIVDKQKYAKTNRIS